MSVTALLLLSFFTLEITNNEITVSYKDGKKCCLTEWMASDKTAKAMKR